MFTSHRVSLNQYLTRSGFFFLEMNKEVEEWHNMFILVKEKKQKQSVQMGWYQHRMEGLGGSDTQMHITDK